ncbi:833_t:CDS:2, partial [Funneliformis mosseae]
ENEISYDTKSEYFNIYSSVAVELTDIIRTDGKFHGKEWFSNIAISSEDPEWYRKYEEVIDGEEMYECLRLYLSEHYMCIYLDSVDISVEVYQFLSPEKFS